MTIIRTMSFILVLGAWRSVAQQQNSTLPIIVNPTVIAGPDNESCPVQENIEIHRNSAKGAIRHLLQNRITPDLNRRLGPPCKCGGRREWVSLAYLDMATSTQQCPSNWKLITSPVRGCGRSSINTSLCNSAIFPSGGRTYHRVCGRVVAYQRGRTNAFFSSVSGSASLERDYLDGVSLTYGAEGSRQHIWSFAAAYSKLYSSNRVRQNCACISNRDWPYSTPSFIGDDYFCDSGNPEEEAIPVTYSADPLWDGEGCVPNNSCCQFNNPPWFCKVLERPTSEGLEVRICGGSDLTTEEVIVSLVDIHVQEL